ncbi:MAG: hypothetical protein WCS31_10155 [Verrucomicrobiae bacterium]
MADKYNDLFQRLETLETFHNLPTADRGDVRADYYLTLLDRIGVYRRLA